MGTPEKSWDELLQTLTPSARQTAAAAKNAKVRVARAISERDEASAVLRAHIRTLHHKHGLTPNRIATILGYSRNRVVDLLTPRR